MSLGKIFLDDFFCSNLLNFYQYQMLELFCSSVVSERWGTACHFGRHFLAHSIASKVVQGVGI